MKRILISAGTLVFVGALAASATGAFFSDTETSTGNTFAAGALDLKVDSEAHYNGSVCLPLVDTDENTPPFTWQGGSEYPVGLACEGTWAETDLGVDHQFFNLSDIKPGDEGENTISLHVYDNDAWGRFLVNNVQDNDNDCTEPETEAVADIECDAVAPATNLGANGLGELAESIEFSAWLDQGAVPGFQCNNPQAVPTVGPCAADLTEGDNIQNGQNEVLFWTGETVDEVSEGPFDLSDILTLAYAAGGCTDTDGNTAYGLCHGLALDGRMVGSTTYYFGLGWSVGEAVGNEAQTDSLVADLEFQVEQHRNNPTPFI